MEKKQKSLTEELKDFRNQARRSIPVEKLNVMDRATQDLARSGIIQKSLKVGDIAPDFGLPDIQGKRVCLSELLALGPVVLTFFRGGW
jgi:hypothetical protein